MSETIEGDPIHVGGRELVPVVRMTSRVRRRAILSNGGVEAYGWGFVQLRPVALLDRREVGGRRLTIRDQTAQSISWLLLIGLVVPCVAVILIYLAHRFHGRTSQAH